MDTEVYKVQPAAPKLPYRVDYGRGFQVFGEFATFPEALAFYQGVGSGYHYSNATGGMDRRIINTDRADGSEDSRCQDGLTEDERAAVEEVG